MTDQDIRVQLARIEQSIVALRADLAQYFAMLQDQETRLRVIEKSITQQMERLDAHVQSARARDNKVKSLERRVNGWGLGNSFASIVAGILAWFK